VNTTAPRARELGFFTCALLGLTTIVGGGIYVLPARLAAQLGPLSPLAFVGAAIVIGFIGLMTAEAAGTTDEPGGAYQYARLAFGPWAGFLVAWVAWFNTVIAWAGISIALANFAEAIRPGLGSGVEGKLVATGSILAFGGLAAAGLRTNARVNNVLMIAKLVPLTVLVLLGFLAFRPESLDRLGSAWSAAGIAGIAGGAYSCIFAAGGFENIGVVAGDVANPKRTIPKAVLVSILASTLFYALIQTAAVVAEPELDKLAPREGAGSLVLPEIAARSVATLGFPAWSDAARTFMMVGAMVSMIGFCTGIAIVSPRYVTTMADGGFLPSFLARENVKGTPIAAIAGVTLLAVALVWGTSFQFLLNGAVLFSLFQHASTVCSAWRLRRRVNTEGRFVAPGGPFVPAAALAAIAGICLFAYTNPDTGADATTNFLTLAGLLTSALVLGLGGRLLGLARPAVKS
jgi:amino acid transporter